MSRSLAHVLLCSALLTTLGCGVSLLPAQAKEVSKEVAVEAAKGFKREFSSRNQRVRLAAVVQIEGLKHKRIVDCLGRALRDTAPKVRAMAARALGHQEPKLAKRYLDTALKAKVNRKNTKVMSAILKAYGTLGTAPPFREVKKRFPNWHREIQKEAIIALCHHRKKETVEFLAPFLDEPKPKDVDNPLNPPSSFWRKKVEDWNYWIPDLQECLHELTGEMFDDQEAAKKWLKKGGKVKPAPKKKKG